MVLLDTDIMVDILRGFPPAAAWLEALGNEEVALPGYVAMELLVGATDRQAAEGMQAALAPFAVYWPAAQDCDRALATFAQASLSHGLSPFDALIAETAKGLGAPLHTFNVKHFDAIADLETIQPYER